MVCYNFDTYGKLAIFFIYVNKYPSKKSRKALKNLTKNNRSIEKPKQNETRNSNVRKKKFADETKASKARKRKESENASAKNTKLRA